MTTEDEAWAQTLVTVTPEEDATIREISIYATLSATPNLQLDLNPNNIVFRRSFTHRKFVDAIESQEEMQQTYRHDEESQTYLEEMPGDYISIEHRDESSQTVYMSPPWPSLKYFRDIMLSMNGESMPKLKRSNMADTIFSFHPDIQEDDTVEQLSMDVIDEQIEEFFSELSEEEETEMEATGIVYFLIARVLWISDPTQEGVETSDVAVQTEIAYNNCTRSFMIQKQTQTELTCEPKESHTKLLTNYWQAKRLMSEYLEDCVSKAIDARVVIDGILDEIIDKCAERIRYPMKEQVIQTIATYKLHGEKDEDVMRKLRMDIIIDPFEASIIIVPLMGDLVQDACDIVSQNAKYVIKDVLDIILRRTSTIIVKLTELQKESQRKPIDQILAKRKEKILESLSKKETETVSTQTSIAAIVEVKKIQKSQEILCSVCRRQSMCQWCLNDGEFESPSQQDIKILRTQDILLSYKPCYIVTKATEKDKYLLQPPCKEKKEKSPTVVKVHTPIDSSGESSDTIRIFLQGGREVGQQESFNEWSYVTEATLMKPYSIKESVSSSSQTAMTMLDQSICQSTSTRQSEAIACHAANVLQILKETFCNQETCATSSVHTLKKNYSLTKNNETCCACLSRSNTDDKVREQNTFHSQQNKPLSKLHLSRTNTYSRSSSSRKKSHGDGFKIIPICISQNSNI